MNFDKPVYFGCNNLRVLLPNYGYTITAWNHERVNRCNWIAYKFTKLKAARCELNPDHPKQIEVVPYNFAVGHEGAVIRAVGQAKGLNCTVEISGLDQIMADPNGIEARLIQAWNTLHE